jgi:hypothetical protein
MLISHSHRFAYIHIPKVAGVSISRTLGCRYGTPIDHYWGNWLLKAIGINVNHYAPYRLRKFRPHSSADTLRRNLPTGLFDSLFTFAFVRNPWDLLVSYYHFLRDAEGHPDHVSHRRRHAARLPDFEAYLRYEIRRGKISQTRMVADRRGRVLVNFLGRYESLRDDFAHVCRELGIDASLGRANASARGDYRDYYTDRLVALVRDGFAEDIERFGYEFSAPTAGARPAARAA